MNKELVGPNGSPISSNGHNAEDIAEMLEAMDSMLTEYGLGLGDLELARDDIGWLKLGGSSSNELDADTRQSSVQKARLYYNRDPLSKQAIRIWTGYSIGRGINFKAKDEKADNILHKFWDSRANSSILSSQGQFKSSDKLLVDGEIFFALFSGKDIKIRRIDPLEITEIVTNPEDQDEVLFYKRCFMKGSTEITQYYADWTNKKPSVAVADARGKSVVATEDAVIYHVAINTLGRRGVSLLLPAFDWTKAHRKFIEARASITQALAKFAWRAKVKGGATQVAAIKNKFQSNLATGGSTENNPPAAAGSTWVENEGLDLTPIKTETGASNAQVDANMLLQMFGAAVGIFPHYFGAGEAFKLATATAMERPMRVMFEAYQEIWSDTYADIFSYVLAENGKLDEYVDIDFPPIVEKDATESVKAIVELITALPELNVPEMQKLLLTKIGINNPDEVLGSITPQERAVVALVKGLRGFKDTLKEET